MTDEQRRKPRGILWLEEQTGQTIDVELADSLETRHLSLRLPSSLYAALESAAATQQVSVSVLVRKVLRDALLSPAGASTAEIDQAIATLKRLRRTSSAAH